MATRPKKKAAAKKAPAKKAPEAKKVEVKKPKRYTVRQVPQRGRNRPAGYAVIDSKLNNLISEHPREKTALNVAKAKEALL